jgi:oligopeptide transport system substrate-binding protein
LGSDPRTLDPALSSSVDGATYLNTVFEGLYSYEESASGKLVIVPGCAEAVVQPTEIDDGKFEYVITLKEGLLWSDGEPMKASDFVYAWNRAANPATEADYQYIFDVIDGYDEENPNLNIAADDEARTITVVTSAYIAYFDQLMAFPTYFPVRKDFVEADPDGWSLSPETYITNGPFKLAEYSIDDLSLVFVKNDNYWDKDAVKLNKLTFGLSDQDDANFAAYEEGTYIMLEPVPVSQLKILKETRLNVDYFIRHYIGTYFIDFNVNASLKPGLSTAGTDAAAWEGWTHAQNAKTREALSLIIDRAYITDEVIGAGQVPANGFIPAGMADGNGKDFRSNAPEWWSVTDVEGNRAKAMEIFEELGYTQDDEGKLTNFPTFVYSTNDNSGNIAIAEAIQSMWKDFGIEASIDKMEWGVYQTAMTNGDFTLGRMGWIADYDDPINFLEIFSTASGNNHPQLGRSGSIGLGSVYGPDADQTWDEYYQTDLYKIKTESDMAARADALYAAEAKLMESMPVVPIYFYTRPSLAKPELKGVLFTPLGFTLFKNGYVEK